MKQMFLTKEGFENLRTELTELKSVKRREIADAIHTAKEQGDLSENAEYQQAKDEQRRLEEKISNLETALKSAQVVEKVATDSVTIGSTVTVNCDGEEKVYMIVGSNEANPLEGKISNESPVGKALLGKKMNESVTIKLPGGDKECEIVKIG